MNIDTEQKLKPVIVTGANGFTGRYVCEEFIKRKVSFLALLRPNSNSDWFTRKSIKVIFADINNYDEICSVLNQGSALVNVASIGFGAAPILVNACKKIGIKRVIFISTTAIFTKLNSKSKSVRLYAENYIANSNLEYTILRPTMIYGSNRDRNLIKLIEWIDKYPIIPVFRKGLALQQPVYVGDVAWAVVESLLNSNSKNKIFNIAGDSPISFSKMIHFISTKMNKRIIQVSINPKLAIFFIKVLNTLNLKIFISEEQINRIIEDKSFPNKNAKKIINFQPLSFENGIMKEINQYLISHKNTDYKL